MRIGIFAPLTSPFATREYISTYAKAAEARDFASIWIGEHVVLFEEYDSKYPYAPDGRIPASTDNGILEPFTTLCFMAGLTERIRLGTGICLVPQRNPVYTAKEVTSLDWLSSGRANFGVGVGWLEEEYAAVDVPFEKRGARCRSYIEVMKRLWREPGATFESEAYSLPACVQAHSPCRPRTPPIYFGGESGARDASRRRSRSRLAALRARSRRATHPSREAVRGAHQARALH